MKRILFINTVCTGSTGGICRNLYDLANDAGYECCIAYGRGEDVDGYNTYRIGNKFSIFYHVLKTRIFDACGLGSKNATLRLIQYIENYNPDIIHIHNLHGYYINIDILFKYLKKRKDIKKIWTLHDYWSITGHCAYFQMNKCEKWLCECRNCKYCKEYPSSLIQNAHKNYLMKRELFSNINNMTIITVSEWMKDIIKQSYLKEYNLICIKNGLDLKDISWDEFIIKKYQKEAWTRKKIILGVAANWNERKGLNDFIKLSNMITNEYIILLVGVTEQQQKILPENIIGIKRIMKKNELYYLYSLATVFFNPTKEETFGLTNLEAQVVGTPVVTYDSGGTKETIVNDNCYVIESKLEKFIEILKCCELNKYRKLEDTIKIVDAQVSYRAYLELYK